MKNPSVQDESVSGNDNTDDETRQGESSESASVPPLDSNADAGSHAISTDSLVPQDNFIRDASGQIVLKADGTPKKRPGRPRKNPTADVPRETATVQNNAPVQATATPAAKRAVAKTVKISTHETARAILGLSVGAAVSFIGPEWDFQSQEEADGMKTALAAYLEAKGDGEMSPETALLLVVSGYALSRLKHENTRTKLSRVFGNAWGWVKSKVQSGSK